MKVISHRGNIYGRNPKTENHPEHIKLLLEKFDFDVEVDVWRMKNHHDEYHYYLGHDDAKYRVDEKFLLNPRIWCHAKNFAALVNLDAIGAHCFMHDKDHCARTSHGYYWSANMQKFANANPDHCAKLVMVHNEKNWAEEGYFDKFFAVCTDYPISCIEDYLLEK